MPAAQDSQTVAPNRASVSKGFTLLEVLIALVIFSFGLLALAALMAKGLQFNTSALHRSYASSQAYDIADRVRANRDGDYTSLSGIGSDQSASTCLTSGCDATAMRDFDRWQWNTTNAAVLPGGSGSVTFASPIYTVTITWDDDRDGAADDSFVFEFRP